MNIGLIAMSGVRACDQELMDLGLTLPGFVERSKIVASLPSLSLLTLAGMTPARHSLTYMEIADLSQAETLPEAFDLVAISSFSAQIHEAYQIAQAYRDKHIPVVIGGLHVTALPQEALAYCDAVVCGEGEPCWLEVLDDCERGCMQGVYDGRLREFRLEDAPLPAYELLDVSKYNRLTVQTSRGCPHRCEFCAGSILLTDQYKQKPIDKVLEEVDKIRRIWHRPFIEFADDNSFVNRPYWQELLGELKKRRIKWFTETDLSVSQAPELLQLMRDSGCAQVLIGLESPVEGGLSGLELRNDWKLKRFSKYQEAIREIQSHGITVNGCFILGLDGHTPDIFESVYQFVCETELYGVQATILTPFPGTPLYARLEREGRILKPGDWRTCTLFDLNFQPSHMSPEALREGFRNLVTRLYSEEFTHWRRRTFMNRLRSCG